MNDSSLCILSFAKFLMWVDLDKHTETLKKNDVVRHLIETPTEPFEQGAFPDQNCIDDNYKPADTYCPVDADPSLRRPKAAVLSFRVLQEPASPKPSRTSLRRSLRTDAASYLSRKRWPH